jgi:hypothetical protein
MVIAHVAGVPVEETLLPLAPMGVAAVFVLRAYVHQLCRALSRRARRPAPQGEPR